MIDKCSSVSSQLKKRSERQCVVCRWEERRIHMQTQYCLSHNVGLCTVGRKFDVEFKNWMCPNTEWTCWKKYHLFYYPKGLFGPTGHIQKTHELNYEKNKFK